MAAARKRDLGASVIVVGALLGLAVSIYNYISPVGFLAPNSSIAGEPGAMLVIVSTALLAIAGLVLAAEVRSRAVTWFFAIAGLLDIVGTAAAAWFLNSNVLIGLMVVCFLGWLGRLGRGEADAVASVPVRIA
jgi:hypothetical protein